MTDPATKPADLVHLDPCIEDWWFEAPLCGDDTGRQVFNPALATCPECLRIYRENKGDETQ